MERIELKFQHQKLVFKIGKREFFIGSDDILSLLDKQRIKETFHSLDPAVIYNSWENLDFCAKITALEERGLTHDEIADHVGTTKERLETWVTERADVIDQIKNQNPANFRAAVNGLKERLVIKRR